MSAGPHCETTRATYEAPFLAVGRGARRLLFFASFGLHETAEMVVNGVCIRTLLEISQSSLHHLLQLHQGLEINERTDEDEKRIPYRVHRRP